MLLNKLALVKPVPSTVPSRNGQVLRLVYIANYTDSIYKSLHIDSLKAQAIYSADFENTDRSLYYSTISFNKIKLSVINFAITRSMFQNGTY
jgi:hypothetical protein